MKKESKRQNIQNVAQINVQMLTVTGTPMELLIQVLTSLNVALPWLSYENRCFQRYMASNTDRHLSFTMNSGLEPILSLSVSASFQVNALAYQVARGMVSAMTLNSCPPRLLSVMERNVP